MKVLLATHFFPPGHPGGTEAYTFGLARTLRRLGHQPFVICAEEWGTGDNWQPRHEDGEHDGIPVRRLYWNWQLAPDPFVNLYDNPETERHFEEYVRQLRPDVVHITSCYALGAGIVRASRRAGAPTFLTLTDFWFLCPRHTLRRGDGSLCPGPESAVICSRCMASDAKVYRTLSAVIPAETVARGLLELAHWPRVARIRGLRGYVGDAESRLAFLRGVFAEVDLAIAPSQFLLDMFVRHGFPADKLRLSRYGIETGWLRNLRPRQATTSIRIGYIGQVEPIKGVDLLVRAFQSIAGEVSAELTIHGDLAKNPVFGEQLIWIAAGNPAIKFVGGFERSQLADVLSNLDVVVVPSVWYENSPVVIAEAFAAQKPVIATNLSGMSELVRHEVNGLLFERGDVDDLARAIRRIVEDVALRQRLRRGIDPVRTIDDEAADLLRLYAAAQPAAA